jgi:hypothetical protein
VSSDNNGSVSDRVRNWGDEHLTSCFEPSEGVLAFLSELAMVKEPRLRLFDGGLNLGIAMDTEVTVRDEIRNNDGVRGGGGLGDDFWSGDRSRFGFGDLDGNRFVNLRPRTRRRSKSTNDSRDAILESLSHRSYPERPSGGRFLSRHLRRNREEPRSSENRLS